MARRRDTPARSMRRLSRWRISPRCLRVFFSGDTGYFDGFKTIGERLGPFDVTLLETGAYDAQWPHVHMLPEHTVQAHIDLRGQWLVPVHNGTFDLAMHAWHEPFERVSSLSAARNIALSTPRMGERLDLAARHIGGSGGGGMWLQRMQCGRRQEGVDGCAVVPRMQTSRLYGMFEAFTSPTKPIKHIKAL